MTENEASFILANIDRRVCDDELSDALDMAIKALEQQPSDDCISREATIDAIYKKYIGGKDAIKNAPINDLYAEGLEEAVDAVWEMPSVTPKAEQRWIPVSERLPEDGDTYLVTIEYNGEVIGVDAASYSPVDGYIDKHWETFNDWKEDDDSCYHVTAWMPLPTSYQGESEDKE